MPFDRPTLSDLRQDVASDIAASLPGADALLRYSNLGIIGDVQAAGLNGLYGYLDWIARQAVPFTATDEYLEAWAALKGIARKAASPASGSAHFTGTEGAAIPVGTPVAGGGQNYTVSTAGTVTAGIALVALEADIAGVSGNLADGTALTLGVAIAGVLSSGTVTGGLAGGADAEADDALRTRMLKAYAAPAQGGSASDYEAWALDVSGVTRAWAARNAMGAGTVVVYFMMDIAEAAHGGFPQGANGVAAAETRAPAATGDQLIVANAIYDLQPVTALVYAVAPIANTIGLTISGIAGSSTATKAAIASAFAAAISLDARPGGTTHISAVESAIASIAASAGFVITGITASAGTITPGAAGNITSAAGALPTAGAITYI